MQEQQLAFDDWEAQADKIDVNTIIAMPNQSKQEQQKAINEKNLYQRQSKLKFIQQIKRVSDRQFQQQFKDKNNLIRQVLKSPLLLKSQSDAVQLSKLVASRLKKQALTNEDNALPENYLYIFFEEMLQYLYPNLQWQNIQYMKEKLKIIKKNRKEEENRARKLREKGQRLKKTHKVQQSAIDNQHIISPEKGSLKEQQEEQYM